MTGKVSGESLQLLHRIHRQLTDLRSRLAKGPLRVSASQSKVNAQLKNIEDLKETLTNTKMLADRKQLQLNEGEAKIGDIEGKLNAAKSNEEFQIFKDQIAAAKMANSVSADEILEAFERVDEIETKISETQIDLKKSESDLAQVQSEVDEERKSLEADIARLEKELIEAEKCLPAEVKSDYLRVAKVKGEEALSQVDGESCGQCYVTIRAQVFNDLLMGKPVFCTTCGAMLYLEQKN